MSLLDEAIKVVKLRASSCSILARCSLEKFLLVLARSIFEKMGFSIYSLKNVKMNLYLKFDVGHARSRMLEKKVLEVSLDKISNQMYLFLQEGGSTPP